MSVYNEKESYLREAVESILNQSFSDFEFIIIDDGSDDKNCLHTLEEFAKKDARIKLIRNNTNLGLTQSLNKALAQAVGKYIARIDSDDIADSRRLEKQLQFMESNPTYALCGSWAYFIDQDGRVTGEKKSPTTYEKIKKRLIFFNFFTHSSLFFQKGIASNFNGYNENLKKAQDYDFILKISAKYPVAILPEFLCSNRQHSKSISASSKKKQEWCALIARWNAVWHYGYPKIDFLKITPAIFYFLFVPYFLEKQIFKMFYKKK